MLYEHIIPEKSHIHSNLASTPDFSSIFSYWSRKYVEKSSRIPGSVLKIVHIFKTGTWKETCFLIDYKLPYQNQSRKETGNFFCRQIISYGVFILYRSAWNYFLLFFCKWKNFSFKKTQTLPQYIIVNGCSVSITGFAADFSISPESVSKGRRTNTATSCG